jgi:hypothetical protein
MIRSSAVRCRVRFGNATQCLARQRAAWPGKARQGFYERFARGGAKPSLAWCGDAEHDHARRCTVMRGSAMHGARLGCVRSGTAGSGPAPSSNAMHCNVLCGKARNFYEAWPRLVRRGLVGPSRVQVRF